jgi:hypothetical protein
MSPSATINERVPVLRQVTRWWVGCRDRRTDVTEFNRWDQDELVSVAHEFGVSTPRLHTLAGKWPDSVSAPSQLTCLNARNPSTQED